MLQDKFLPAPGLFRCYRLLWFLSGTGAPPALLCLYTPIP